MINYFVVLTVQNIIIEDKKGNSLELDLRKTIPKERN